MNFTSGSASTYGLNKEARLRAEREKQHAENSQEPSLNPTFPFEVLTFSPETFGITHYSDAEPDKPARQL
jgi:hypothetical protein